MVELPVGAIRMELLGTSLAWAGVIGVTGVALCAYGLMLRREPRRELPPIASPLAARRATTAARGSRLPDGSTAILAGILALLLTPILLLLTWRGQDALAQWGAMAATLMVALTAVFLFYCRVFQYLSRGRLTILFALRAVGLLAITLLLFQPVIGFVRTPDSRPRLAIVVDASGSMSYSDAINEPSRFQQAAIAVQDTLAPRLRGTFDLQFFAYDGKHSTALATAEALRTLPPDGDVTDLGGAIGLGVNSGARQVILLSDGIHNGATSLATEVVSLGSSVPVHTVRIGSSDIEPSTVPDIVVTTVEGPQSATVNNSVTLTASLKSTAMSDRTVHVLLTAADKSGGTLADERLVLHSGPTPQTVQLHFTPDKVGRASVKVQVPVDPGERSAANNEQEFSLLVTDPKLAVLYVEGRVRPEVGPLRRVLEQDPNIDAISMVQTQAGKFELRGVKPGDPLHGLPTSLAGWKRFKVIILGDLDASFLSPQQQKDLEQVVNDGAGLLMIGGQNAFAPGGWNKTVLAQLLPVSLSPVDPPQINTKFVPELTAAGEHHPILAGIASDFISPDGSRDPNSQQMPDLSGCVALAGAKPAATVLAVHPTEKIGGAPAIVLAVEQYGKGRTAAFAADTTWHWSLFLRGLGKDSPYNRFWGQTVRWLASQEELQKKTGPSVTAMLGKARYEPGEPVLVRAAVTDAQGQSTNFASVWADITGPDGKTVRLPLPARTDGSIGMYEAKAQPTLSGVHKVVIAASKDKVDLGKDDTTFTVLSAAGERDVLAANPANLQAIAHATGGSYVELPGVAALADRLTAELPSTAVALTTTVPLYNNRVFFLVFIGSFATEWFLRRKWQLQ